MSRPQSKKNQTQDPQSQKSSTNSPATLDDLLKLISPLVEFHRDVLTASDNDLRIFWDVRVLRGTGETFLGTTGSSAMPGLLGDKMKPLSPGMIQQEINEKIAAPLVAELQGMVETDTFGNMDERNQRIAQLANKNDTPNNLLGNSADEFALLNDRQQA